MMVCKPGIRALSSLAFAVLVASGTALPAFAVEASDPRAVVTQLDQSLLDVMQNASKLGYKGRYAKLEPVVRQVFDVPFMTKVAVGAGWSTLTDDQQAALTDAFSKFIAATYARRFDGYGGEKFVTKGTQPSGGNILVQTDLVKSDGEPIALNYVTRQQSDGHWQVVDVFLTGTISELATRRSEFSSVFRRAGYEGLLSVLHEKVAQIAHDSDVS